MKRYFEESGAKDDRKQKKPHSLVLLHFYKGQEVKRTTHLRDILPFIMYSSLDIFG